MSRRLQWLLSPLIAVACALGRADGVDLTGYWVLDAERSDPWPSAAVLTPAAADQVERFDARIHDPATVCMPFGMPRVMAAVAAYPMEIIQTAAQVTLLFDSHDEIRRVFIGRENEEDRSTRWLGYSTGRWQNETLVVETSHINDATLVTEQGIPHSRALQVTERFTLLEGGRTLRNEMTLRDESSFERPVTRRLYYRATPETQPREFACSERLWHEHVMRRAKQLTREISRGKAGQ